MKQLKIILICLTLLPLLGIVRSDNVDVAGLSSPHSTDTPTRFKAHLLPSGLSVSFTEHPLKVIEHKKWLDQVAEKARLAAIEARQQEIALEKQRAAQKAAQAVKPHSKPVQTNSGCTTYHSTGALEQLILHESGGNTCATNAGGCFGLLQACPGAPLKEACGGNPDCQIAWFIANKTGGRSWDQIWSLWQSQGWW